MELNAESDETSKTIFIKNHDNGLYYYFTIKNKIKKGNELYYLAEDIESLLTKAQRATSIGAVKSFMANYLTKDGYVYARKINLLLDYQSSMVESSIS